MNRISMSFEVIKCSEALFVSAYFAKMRFVVSGFMLPTLR